MCKMAQIVHCDRCSTLLMCYENYCSWCRKERKDIKWEPVAMNSPTWWERSELRDPSRGGYEMSPFHCDRCYAVISFISDNFCGYCGKIVTAMEWPYIEDVRDPEFSRREELRVAASPDERRVKDPTLDVDTRKGAKK